MNESIHWLEARKIKDVEIELVDAGTNAMWLMHRGFSEDILVTWSDGAAIAQTWLKSVQFTRCARRDCKIRTSTAMLGDFCTTHDQAMDGIDALITSAWLRKDPEVAGCVAEMLRFTGGMTYDLMMHRIARVVQVRSVSDVTAEFDGLLSESDELDSRS